MKQALRKYLISVTLLFLLFSFKGEILSQENTFVQCLFQEIHSQEQVTQLDSLFTSKSGVQFSRFNFVTQNLLVVFNSTESYDYEDFKQWLNELDYEFICFYKGILGQDSMKELKISNCSEFKLSED